MPLSPKTFAFTSGLMVTTSMMAWPSRATAGESPGDVSTKDPISREVAATEVESAAPKPKIVRVADPRLWRCRFGLGASYLSASGNYSEESDQRNLSMRGLGALLHADFELRVASGLYLGGAFALSQTFSTTVETDGEESQADDVSIINYAAGPSLSYYFGGDRGPFVRGLAGLSGMKLRVGEGKEAVDSATAVGPVFAAATGYEFSASPTFSWGAEVRFAWAKVSNHEGGADESYAVALPGLTLTGTFGGSRW